MPPDLKDESKKATLLARYRSTLQRHPLLGNCVQSALISACADTFKQRFVSKEPFSVRSVLRQAFLMAFVNTPTAWCIYGMYDRLKLGVAAKLFLDQAVLCWFTNSLSMAVLHALNSRPLSALPERVKSGELMRVVVASWKVWLPAKAVMFGLVPPVWRFLYQSCVAFGWQIILSLMLNN